MTWAEERFGQNRSRCAVLAVAIVMSGEYQQAFSAQRAGFSGSVATITRKSHPFDRISVPLPSGWRLLPVDEPADVIDMVNFPVSRQIRGTVIPLGGARITMLLSNRGASAQERIPYDVDDSGLTVAPRKLQGVPYPTIEAAWSSGDPFSGLGMTTAFYVKLPTGLLCVYATYLDEASGRLVRQTAVAVIGGIRTVPRGREARKTSK